MSTGKLTFSAVAFLFYVMLQTSFTSCTKTNTVTKTVTDTVNVVQIDTVIKKDTALTTAILTANSWKIQELRGLFEGDYIYYLRGGTNNTQSFDNESITFNSDNTGIYIDNAGNHTSLTWNFTDATNTSIIWTWNLTTPVVVTWQNIFYKNASLHYDEYFTQNGENELASGIRIPE